MKYNDIAMEILCAASDSFEDDIIPKSLPAFNVDEEDDDEFERLDALTGDAFALVLSSNRNNGSRSTGYIKFEIKNCTKERRSFLIFKPNISCK